MQSRVLPEVAQTKPLAAILDALDGGVLALDSAGTVLYCNRAMTALAGEGDVLARLTSQAEHPEAAAALFERCLHDPASVGSARLILRDGRALSLRCRASSHAIVLQVDDIGAALVERLEHQRRTNERVRTLIEATAQAIWTADSDGEMNAYSPSWSKLTGQRPEDMIGQGWLHAVDAEARPRVKAAWEASVRSGKPFAEQFRVWSPQNRFLHVRARGMPSSDTHEWVVACTDVTEQAQAQQQLEERARHAAFRSSLKEVLASSDIPSDVLVRCCAAVVEQLSLAGSALWLKSEESATLKLQAHTGVVPPSALVGTVPFENNEIGRFASQPRGHIDNALGRGSEQLLTEWAQESGIVSMVGHPLSWGDQVQGVLVAFADVVLPVNLLEQIRDGAETIATWMRAQRIEQRLRRSLSEERASRLRTAMALSGATFGAFLSLRAGEPEGTLLLSVGPGFMTGRISLSRARDALRRTFGDEPRLLLAHDLNTDERFTNGPPFLPEPHPPVRSYLAVPLIGRKNEIIGGLLVGHTETHRFTPEHVARLELLAGK